MKGRERPFIFVDKPSICQGSEKHSATLALNFLHGEALDDIAFLDVVKALQANAALKVRAHLASVVLIALEGIDLGFRDHDVIAQEPGGRVALDLALGDIAARNRAHAGNLEGLPHLRAAEDGFFILRREQAPFMAFSTSSIAL